MHKHSHSLAQPGWSLDLRDPQVIESFMPFWEGLYRYYFRVQTSGWEHIPADTNVMLVGSHNGGLAAPDMQMMMYDWFRRFGCDRPAYGLMHSIVWQLSSPLSPLSRLAAQVGAVRAHPKMAIAALQRGASVLVYPGGAKDVFRPHALRHKICLEGNQAFVKLALRHQVPIVPLISCGAHDTLLVLTDAYTQMQELHRLGMPWVLGIDPQVFPIYLGLPWGLGFGPLPHIPLPVKIHTRVLPAIMFERYGHDAAQDKAYVNDCYNQVCTQMQQGLNQLVEQADSDF